MTYQTYSTPKALKGDRVALLIHGQVFHGTVVNVKREVIVPFMYEVLVDGGMTRFATGSEIINEEDSE